MLFIQTNMPKRGFDITVNTVALKKICNMSQAFSILFNDFGVRLVQDFLTISRPLIQSALLSVGAWSLLCNIAFFSSFTRLTEFCFGGL